MRQQLSDDAVALWQHLVHSQHAFTHALQSFFSEGVDRVALIQQALKRGDIATAMYVAPHLSGSEQVQLFSDWLEWATCPHGYLGTVREIIRSLPRTWVVANIETMAEPMLQHGTYDEYRRLLELYIELDRDLTLRLARRAAENADNDIREAGEDFLTRLNAGADGNYDP